MGDLMQENRCYTGYEEGRNKLEMEGKKEIKEESRGKKRNKRNEGRKRDKKLCENAQNKQEEMQQ
jgi:hypothetical protein